MEWWTRKCSFYWTKVHSFQPNMFVRKYMVTKSGLRTMHEFNAIYRPIWHSARVEIESSVVGKKKRKRMGWNEWKASSLTVSRRQSSTHFLLSFASMNILILIYWYILLYILYHSIHLITKRTWNDSNWISPLVCFHGKTNQIWKRNLLSEKEKNEMWIEEREILVKKK